MFKSWDVLVAPSPDPVPRSAWRFRVSMCSPWISVNVLMLDEKRVIVEHTQNLADQGPEGLGIPADSQPLLELRPLRRVVPLRDPRYPAARSPAIVFLVVEHGIVGP